MLSGFLSIFGSSKEGGGRSNAKVGVTAATAAAAAKAKEKAKKKEIIRRQKKLAKEEIVQSWRIAVGKEIPKKKKDTFLVKNITRRNVWMEDLFVFNQIKAHFPDEIFYPPSHYILKWQPLGSYFQIIVKLDDPALQENAVIEMAKMTKAQQKKTLFLFTTLDSTAQLFAPKVHPASLVSYRQKNEVLKKLSEYFLQGKIKIEDFEQILVCSPDIWSNSLYNYLPGDEQVYHQYLNEKIVHEDPNKSLTKKFLDEQLTLKQYEDLKYPDRKEKAERDSMFYPLPFEGGDCIICGEEKTGVVQCHTCDNMVCPPCILRVFHGKVTANRKAESSKGKQEVEKSAEKESEKAEKESYLLLHHRYCMRLGAVPELKVEVIAELGYLREFRKTTRTEVLNKFNPDRYLDFEDDSLLADYDEEELERRRLQALKQKEQEEEEKRQMELQNPPELQEKRKTYEERKKKFEKMKKELIEVAEKAADTSRAEQYVARNRRLKVELMEKFQKVFLPTILELHRQVGIMNLPGQYLPALMREVHTLLTNVESFLASVEE